MRLSSWIAPLLATQGVVASQRARLGDVNAGQMIDLLTTSQNILPLNGRIMLKERTKQLKLKRQSDTMTAILGSIAGVINDWNLPRPNAKVPDEQISTSDWPGATRKKIRYGPYRIPPTSEENLESKMLKQQGLANTLAVNAKKPCTGNCVVFAIQPGLEYADGTVADTPNGAWLHHAVLINYGSEVQDATCPEGLQSYMEHLFESGNERTVIPYARKDFPIKSGYHLRSSDSFLMNTELMNMDNTEKWAWLTLTFDYVEDKAKDYMDGKIVWMSIGPNRCGSNNYNPFGATNLTTSQQPTAMKMVEYSIPWVSHNAGFILGANGHMHEGGTAIRVFKNGEDICNSIPHYEKTAVGGMHMGNKRESRKRQIDLATIEQLASMYAPTAPASSSRPQKLSKVDAAQAKLQPMMAPSNYTNSDIEFIVSQSFCNFEKPLDIKVDDTMYIVSDYNFYERPGMKNKKGEEDEIMGIAGALMAFPYTPNLDG